MADRGTAYSATADQYEFDAFAHLMEPLADFGAQFYSAPEATFFESDSYTHPMEPTADWGDQFNGLYYGPW